MGSIHGDCLGIYSIFAIEWRRHRNRDRYSNRREREREQGGEESLKADEAGVCTLTCPTEFHLRPGSQLTVRGAQSSILDGPAFFSLSLACPRVRTRNMTKGPRLDPRAREMALIFFYLCYLLAMRLLPDFTTQHGCIVS